LSFLKRLKNVKFYIDKASEEGIVVLKTLRLVFVISDSVEITAL